MSTTIECMILEGIKELKKVTKKSCFEQKIQYLVDIMFKNFGLS